MPETYLRTGPFVSHVTTSIDTLLGEMARLYPAAWFSAAEAFADFHLAVEPPSGPRRWISPQVLFKIDGASPFRPLARSQALALFEWGLNACIGTRANQFLIYHAAVVERGGRAAIMPGTPGAGKSTLTAALVHRGGWRLLSDELTLLSPDTGRVTPLARPINLKNQSIAVLRDYLPDAVFSAEVRDTMKGTVCLLRAPEESMARVGEPATARWVIFPRWKADAAPHLRRVPRGAAMIEIGMQSFNYSAHGARGFTRTADLIEQCDCLRFEYSRLDEAIAAFDELAAQA
jgi:HprK-related kinase A